MKLIEFSFAETPMSLQSRNKRRKRSYMNRIGALASSVAAVGFPNSTDDFYAKITYFHQGNTDLDVDNIIKPILDSLNGILYADDKQVGEVNCKRIDLTDNYTITNSTPLLNTQLTQDNEFVYVELFQYDSIF